MTFRVELDSGVFVQRMIANATPIPIVALIAGTWSRLAAGFGLNDGSPDFNLIAGYVFDF